MRKEAAVLKTKLWAAIPRSTESQLWALASGREYEKQAGHTLAGKVIRPIKAALK